MVAQYGVSVHGLLAKIWCGYTLLRSTTKHFCTPGRADQNLGLCTYVVAFPDIFFLHHQTRPRDLLVSPLRLQ